MKKSNLIFVIITFYFSSCRTVIYYSNNPVNNPQVDEQGDFNISGGVNASELNTGFNANGYVAVTDHIYAGGSFTNFSGSRTPTSYSDSITDKFSGSNLNMTAGYYKKLKNGFVFETGLGYTKNYNANSTGPVHTNIYSQKYYLQPGISRLKEKSQWGFAVRVGILDITNVISDDPSFNGTNSGFDGMFLIEPGINFSFGKTIKAGFQLSHSFHHLSGNSFTSIFGGAVTDDFSLSLFLKLDINRSRD
jgi:hypothetical protein